MRVTRVNESYAWAECINPRTDRPTCQNTVKFGADGSETCCPSCSTLYVCQGDKARKVGYITHTDDFDPGTAHYTQ